MEVKLDKLYTQRGLEYMGGENLKLEAKECPLCKGNMIKTPFKFPFIETKDGFFLVQVSQTNGMMMVIDTQPEYIWACHNCQYAESISKPKPVEV